ncbi:MAG: DUF5030 domain-containing protein [Paraprevotella sp.]|nr:DUF5030 domain-containing protein [Paraprevotella sp.]
MKYLFAIVLVSLSMLGTYGQKEMPFSELQEKWEKYRQCTIDPLILRKNHFHDTISVEEMREAFFKYKGHSFRWQKLCEGMDTMYGVMPHVRVVLQSPLQQHPQKEMREYRGKWSALAIGEVLTDIKDKDGVSRKDILDKLIQDKATWLDGEIIALEEPRCYMGFVVSPSPRSQVYHKGTLLGVSGTGSLSCSDFFSYATFNHTCLDGNWDCDVYEGSVLLGMLHGMSTTTHRYLPERTFSVLLHSNLPAKAEKKDKKKYYTLELLEPKEADKETVKLFEDFKEFVERLPEGTFKPYYTIDFRLLTGHYYHVTVNKCGWLVEDYFTLK